MTETRFEMISEWMVNGNISEFVKAHPDADLLGLVGFSFRVPLTFPRADRRSDDLPVSLKMSQGG